MKEDFDQTLGNVNADPTLEQLNELLDGRMRTRFSTSDLRKYIEEAVNFRYPNQTPPGYLDAEKDPPLLNNEISVFVRPARGAALSDLAGDLPAPVLAELLGLSISSATRWVALAARDHADYLAARIAKPPDAK